MYRDIVIYKVSLLPGSYLKDYSPILNINFIWTRENTKALKFATY